MRSHKNLLRWLAAGAGVLIPVLVLGAEGYAGGNAEVYERVQLEDGIRHDPEKIVGAERCVNCHQPEHDQWQTTHHFMTFNGADGVEAMHRRPEAAEILENLDLRSARRGVCTNCHYTLQGTQDRNTAVAGVSCESCHGAAADWVETHGVYGEDTGGVRATRETEPAAHRESRLAQAEAAGMIRTHNIYALVENCFQCHTVPNEELVDVGGHTAGSDINFLEWLHREVRHNYLYSEGAENRRAPRDMDAAARSRVLYVVAELVDVEYGLRGLATATQDGDFAQSLQARIDRAVGKLEAIASAEPATSEGLGRVIAEVRGLELRPNNTAALNAAAETVKAEAQRVARSDGGALGGIDSLLPAIR